MEDEHVAFDENGSGYGPGQSLRARDRRKALLTAVVLPYILAKLDAEHERHVETEFSVILPDIRLPYGLAAAGGVEGGRA